MQLLLEEGRRGWWKERCFECSRHINWGMISAFDLQTHGCHQSSGQTIRSFTMWPHVLQTYVSLEKVGCERFLIARFHQLCPAQKAGEEQNEEIIFGISASGQNSKSKVARLHGSKCRQVSSGVKKNQRPSRSVNKCQLSTASVSVPAMVTTALNETRAMFELTFGADVGWPIDFPVLWGKGPLCPSHFNNQERTHRVVRRVWWSPSGGGTFGRVPLRGCCCAWKLLLCATWKLTNFRGRG